MLPVTRVVLYKSGVGYFEHLTAVTGSQSLAIQFTADQLDDVLKSLSALDLNDGRITGVSYDSPTPLGRRLQGSSLPLGANASTHEVLSALRGSRIEVRDARRVLAGRLLNVERRATAGNGQALVDSDISMLTDAGEIVAVPLTGTTRVRLADASTRQEVRRYLSVSATSGERVPRQLTIHTAGTGRRQIVVGYVGEAAVWKTTYRLIFPIAGGSPILQGWGVVDNLSASDWNGVELSMVAGSPQSYRQPLSMPVFAPRPVVPIAGVSALVPTTFEAPIIGGASRVGGVVRDASGAVMPGTSITLLDHEGRVVASSVSDAGGRYNIEHVASGVYTLQATLAGFTSVRVPGLELRNTPLEQGIEMQVGALSEAITVSSDSPTISVARSLARGVGRPPSVMTAPDPPSRTVVEQSAVRAPVGADGAELGDLFEYKLRDRVFIARNRSALVPILQAAVPAERVSLWNLAMGQRPRRAVWLTNSSQLTLDAGSLSVVDAGAFAGEGLTELLKPGERRLIAYAADNSVLVNGTSNVVPERLASLRIAHGVLTRTVDERRQRLYTVRNNDREPRTVIVEHPFTPGWTLASSLRPDETTATLYRFRMAVAPGETATLDVGEEHRASTTVSVSELNENTLASIAAEGEARDRLASALAPLLTTLAALREIDVQVQKRADEASEIREDQERVRDNMGALKGSAEERRLLERYTKRLDGQETRLEGLTRETAELHGRAALLQRRFAEQVEALTFDGK